MRIIFTSFLLIVTLTVKSQSDSDFQVWLINNLSSQINKDWKVSFHQRYNLGFNEFRTELNLFEMGFTYDLTDWFSMKLSYKQLYFNNNETGFYSENRPQLAGILSTEISDFDLAWRNRLDYRHFKIKDSFFSYNNKVTLSYIKFPIQPFLSEEFFYNLEKSKIETVRLCSGISFGKKFLEIDIYYGYQMYGMDSVKKIRHALGNTIAFEF